MEKNIKLPKTIKVGGIDYKIIILDKFKDDDMSAWGYHCKSDAEILLLSNYDNEPISITSQIHTLLHEIIHAIDSIYCKYVFTEDQVEKLTDILYQIFADNDLYIGEHKLPKYIKILGKKFKIIKEYKFEDWNNSDPRVLLSVSETNIKCSKCKSCDTIKSDMLETILKYLCNIHFNKEEQENIDIHTFSSGVYQVIKDNKLDKLIRSI